MGERVIVQCRENRDVRVTLADAFREDEHVTYITVEATAPGLAARVEEAACWPGGAIGLAEFLDPHHYPPPMSRPSWSTVGVALGLIALAGACVFAPALFAVEGTIGLATTEPVHVTDVACSTGPGRSGTTCTGTWTLSDGTSRHGRLSAESFISDGEDFDGYGNGSTAAPTRWPWILSQLLYLIPAGLLVAFLIYHRRRMRRLAAATITAEDEAAMDARAEEIRRQRRATPSADEPG